MVRFFVTFFKLSLATIVILIISMIVVALFLFHSYSKGLPSVEELRHYHPDVLSRVYANDGNLLAEYAKEKRVYLPSKQIPDIVKKAVVSAEDKHFYSHRGIDIKAIIRSAILDVGIILNGENKRLSGASTITQQVAKNFFLSSERVISRKIREAILALRIEEALSKEEILELYLNRVFLGHHSYGVATASLNYFNKSIDKLDIAEAAFLAGLFKGAPGLDPIKHYERALNRRNWVINNMYDNGYISKSQAEYALDEPILYNPPSQTSYVKASSYVEEVRRTLVNMYGENGLFVKGLSVLSTLDPNIQRLALRSFRSGLEDYSKRHGYLGAIDRIPDTKNWKQYLISAYDKLNKSPEHIWHVGIVLKLDKTKAKIGYVIEGKTEVGAVERGLQRDKYYEPRQGFINLSSMHWAFKNLPDQRIGKALTSIKQTLKVGDLIYVREAEYKEVGKYWGANFLSKYKEKRVDNYKYPHVLMLEQIPEVNGAMMVMNAHNGQILAMIGGYNQKLGDFNRAVQAERQPGSLFKPIVYLTALENGFNPTSLVLDAPFALKTEQGVWRPKNYSKKYYGFVPLRVGLEKSRNLMTIRLAQELGMEKIIEQAVRFGVVSDMKPLLSNALGSTETTLFNMMSAYSAIVNMGKKVVPHQIEKIQDLYGKTIYRFDKRDCSHCYGSDENKVPFLQDDKKRIAPADATYQLLHLMQGVVLRGTARRLASLGHSLAGKTGTTNDEKDAWFIGFTPNIMVGVYVGFDTPKTLGSKEGGGYTAAPIAKKFFEEYLKEKSDIPFDVPAGIRLVWVNSLTGEKSSSDAKNAILEAFKEDEEPNSANFSVDADEFNLLYDVISD